ncbi:hypothetical protein JCM33374_g2600 [Metschnikowia sp. JCM 33374]|nr:hypothetical protein JCM33374_g2600 [Metschnikowia sp. JCM 33374]
MGPDFVMCVGYPYIECTTAAWFQHLLLSIAFDPPNSNTKSTPTQPTPPQTQTPMNTRKSCRRSVGVEKPDPKQIQQTNSAGHDQKRRKINLEGKSNANSICTTEASGADDKIDPVEKLLSFSHSNTDMLSVMNDTENANAQASSATSSNSAAYPHISYNFNKVIHDNMRSYYSKFRKSQMEIHNDHSSFSVLNKPPPSETPEQETPARAKFQVPFFRNVNFNPKPSFGQHIDDYIHYDDDEDDQLTTDSEHEEIASPKGLVETPIPSLSGKMSFHYRQNDKLNLSLTDEQRVEDDAPNDVFKFLNKRSVLSGKASEMIGTSNFLVSDFFF